MEQESHVLKPLRTSLLHADSVCKLQYKIINFIVASRLRLDVDNINALGTHQDLKIAVMFQFSVFHAFISTCSLQ